MSRLIYHTVLISERNIMYGYFKDGDFGYIDLKVSDDIEAPILCKIKDGSEPLETIRVFEGYCYSDYNRWDKIYYFKDKQGRLTENTAKSVMVESRNISDSYYMMQKIDYILVGKRIYRKYCKRSELMITQTGNTLFGDWWSLDIESHHTNKSNVIFNRKNFENELRKAKKRLEPINKRKRINFFYPRIYWPEDQKTKMGTLKN